MVTYEDMKDRIAVVTGAASGIGKATACGFAENGAIAVFADINLEGAQQAADEMIAKGYKAKAVMLDVRKYEVVESVVNDIIAEFGQIDYWINVAGGYAGRMCGKNKPFRDYDIDVLDWGLEVNLRGVMYCCRAIVGHMMDRHFGKIVNLGSVAGCVGTAGGPDYSAEKAGIIGLTKSLGIYLGPYGVNCNCVSPGPVLSRPEMSALPTYLGRAAQPREVADLILYLCSEKASFMTGHNYVIDGGRCWGTTELAAMIKE